MYVLDSFINGLVSISQPLTIQASKQARKILLDNLGVMIGGKRYLSDHHPELIDSFFNGTTKDTAFLEGFASHVLELDDGHRHGMIHLGASIVPAILAVAEKEKISSDSFIRGIVMGYEVAIRCAESIQPGHKLRGYHASGTCGTLGAAMGIAFACGFNESQLRATIACAVSSAAGVLEIQEQSSELKPFNIGRAALDGVLAAQIGKLSLPGPDDILGGERGFLAALTDTPNPEYLRHFSNGDYAIEGIYQKVHAACRHCHPAIDATLAIRNDINLVPEQIDRIVVRTYKHAIVSHNHVVIKGISSAKLSTPYSVALAIVKGSVDYSDYNEDNLQDYWINYLTKKVCVIEDEELTQCSPEIRGAKVDIYLKNGQSYESTCYYPKGEPENPLSHQELEDKFRRLAMYGGLTSKECDKVIDEVWKEIFDLKKIMNIICK